MKNIVLIGMMGSGKSTIGALLAQRLGRTLVDTDQRIVEREGRSISEIFADKGEGYFRDLELAVARELGEQRDLIVACGGGLPLRENCITPLKESGTVFWLRRDPGETYDTMDTAGRPLAQQGRQDFLDRFAQREPIYRRWADYIIDDFSSPEATLQHVLEALK
jgi:shikimate kinase